jgi:hypothetical protein
LTIGVGSGLVAVTLVVRVGSTVGSVEIDRVVVVLGVAVLGVVVLGVAVLGVAVLGVAVLGVGALVVVLVAVGSAVESLMLGGLYSTSCCCDV